MKISHAFNVYLLTVQCLVISNVPNTEKLNGRSECNRGCLEQTEAKCICKSCCLIIPLLHLDFYLPVPRYLDVGNGLGHNRHPRELSAITACSECGR